ncbi:MAG: pirin family protein [Paraperlucidibaca sp.]
MKQINGIYTPPRPHWVGDGFPVRTLFNYSVHANDISPFLMLDHAGPKQFTPSAAPRGVGVHPHRGFETVTIVYDGEVSHRDSSGVADTIYRGDVQWMTAGAGILHEEFHSERFTANGGTMEMAQLWVNLPAKDKLTPPRYQGIVAKDIPTVALANGSLRVIAGEYANQQGPALTFSPLNVWDLSLHTGAAQDFSVPDGHSLIVVVLNGEVVINREQPIGTDHTVVFAQHGSDFSLEALVDSQILVLSGEPLNEAIEGYGPFVMNTRHEINQAITDFNQGRFGQL